VKALLVRARKAIEAGDFPAAREALLEAWNKKQHATLAWVIDRIPPATRAIAKRPFGGPFTLDESALARAIADALDRRNDPVAEVFADPSMSDARLLVLADELTERGDPRGELITVQLAKPGSRREQQLLKTYRRLWLGPIEPNVDEVVWRRGFPVEARLRHHDEDNATRREWATFETLDIQHAPTTIGKLLFGGACRSLRRLRRVRAAQLREMTRDELPLLETLHGSCYDLPHPDLAALRLPRLRTLVIDGHYQVGDWALLGTEVGQRLEHLALVRKEPDVGAAMAAARRAPNLRTLALVEGDDWDGDGEGWRVRLERVERGWRLRVTIACAVRASLIDALQSAPAGAWTEVLVDASLDRPDPLMNLVDAELQRLG
jgi:hypothetical protein